MIADPCPFEDSINDELSTFSLSAFCDKFPHLMETLPTPGYISHSFILDSDSVELIISVTDLLSNNPVSQIRPTCKNVRGITGHSLLSL